MLRVNYNRKTYAVVTVCVVVFVLLLVPPGRNLLCLGYIPKAWRSASTFQLIKVYSSTFQSHMAALSPCRQPGHPDLSDSPRKVRTHTQDVRLYTKAETWINASSTRKQRFSPYLPKLTLLEKARLVETWQVLHRAFVDNNIDYFLVQGGLLGAIRHEGIIPWDDDLGIAVHVKYAEKITNILSCIPGYTLRVTPNMHWKIFPNDGDLVDKHSGTFHSVESNLLKENENKNFTLQYEFLGNVVLRYPFVDIFLMTNDDSYMWLLTNYQATKSLFCKEDVYPLRLTPFEGYLAPVPGRSHAVLNTEFDGNTCVSSRHGHADSVSRVPCHELRGMYKVNEV